MSRSSMALLVLLCLPLVVAAAPAPARITSYKNPILPGFYPDPSVVRVGEWFYMVNSTFEFFPGVPVHRSRDLVNWETIGHALTRASQLPLEGARPSGGIFAPTIRHHDGTFYMITTNIAKGNFYVTAKDAAGPWSEPIWITEQGGIDPSLYFDEDGTVYLTTNGGPPNKQNENGIWQSAIDVTTGKLLSEPKLVWKGTGGRYPEGPHLFKRGDRYYLLISEGGTEYGHMVTIARSDTPWGPFESCPRNPIFTHRHTQMDVPIQGTGHPDFVEDAEGNWWTVFLAFRPVGGWYWHHLGRETYLAPVAWDKDGWPVVNEGKVVTPEMTVKGLPEHKLPAVPVRDGFDGPLGFAWNYLRNPVADSYSTTKKAGWLTLDGTAVTLRDEASPTWVGRRQQHLKGRMATRLDFAPKREGDEAGLVLYRHPHHRYELGVRKANGRREVFVRQTIGKYLSAVTASADAPGEGPVVLQVDAEPEEYTLSWGTAEGKLAKLDGAVTRYLSSEVTGGFIGTYVGLYATGNGQASTTPAAFDWFDYEPK